MLSVVQKSAIAYVERAEKCLGYVAGKKASKALDKGALEFAVGVAIAVEAAQGAEAAEAKAAAMFAFMVSIRGFSWVQEMAKDSAALEAEAQALEGAAV